MYPQFHREMSTGCSCSPITSQTYLKPTPRATLMWKENLGWGRVRDQDWDSVSEGETREGAEIIR